MKVQTKVALAMGSASLALSAFAGAHLYREVAKAKADDGPVPAMSSARPYGTVGD